MNRQISDCLIRANSVSMQFLELTLMYQFSLNIYMTLQFYNISKFEIGKMYDISMDKNYSAIQYRCVMTSSADSFLHIAISRSLLKSAVSSDDERTEDHAHMDIFCC